MGVEAVRTVNYCPIDGVETLTGGGVSMFFLLFEWQPPVLYGYPSCGNRGGGGTSHRGFGICAHCGTILSVLPLQAEWQQWVSFRLFGIRGYGANSGFGLNARPQGLYPSDGPMTGGEDGVSSCATSLSVEESSAFAGGDCGGGGGEISLIIGSSSIKTISSDSIFEVPMVVSARGSDEGSSEY